MKTIAAPAMAAIEAGEAIVTGAVEITPASVVITPIEFTEGDAVDLSWWQATYEQTTNDQARMGIGFRDELGAEIGTTLWATMIDPTPSMAFQERTLSTTVPAGATRIRLYQEMQRRSGTNNDGYIDAISLQVGGVTYPVFNSGAENGNTDGWTDEAGAIGVRRASPDAHEGIWYFTGGRSLLSRAYQDVYAGAVVDESEGQPIRLWGGYGPIEIAGHTFQGIGSRGMAQQNAGAVGGIAQGMTLALSGVEPAALALLDANEIKGAPVVLYRLIFASDGKTLLDAHVFDRGRSDAVDSDEKVGGEATISVAVESAARGLGRSGGRRRSDSDQRLMAPDDGYFKNTAYAGQKTLYWGGKKPSFGTPS